MVSAGITGGIGSGKTRVCEVWKSMGAFVLNADDLAKRIMVEDEDVIAEIRQAFGTEAYHKDGTLNRAYLAREAFEKGRVEELNAIVHPRIPAKSGEIKEEAGKEGHNLFVYEAALLFENLRPGFLDYIVLVRADEDKRVKRVQQRDGVPEEKVRERMEKQQNFSQLQDRADFVIFNNGTLRELKEQAEKLYWDLVEQDKSN